MKLIIKDHVLELIGCLSDYHPEGGLVQDDNGRIPLHYACERGIHTGDD